MNHDSAEGPFRGGKVWVLTRKCTTCIFRPGNLMHLRPGRVDQMVADCLTQDTAISCHSTLDGPQSICRGFYDRHRRDVLPLRAAVAFNMLAFTDPPEGH